MAKAVSDEAKRAAGLDRWLEAFQVLRSAYTDPALTAACEVSVVGQSCPRCAAKERLVDAARAYQALMQELLRRPSRREET